MHFHLIHIVPDPRLHGLHGYLEVMETVRWGLEGLGHRVTASVNAAASAAVNIVFGVQLLDEAGLRSLPPDTIAYNLEQITNVPPEQMLAGFSHAAKNLRVWDYSRQNLPVWQSMNPAHEPRLVKIGYAPILTRIPKRSQEAIDVLFYGLPSNSRLSVFRDLCLSGLRAVYACGLYGAPRDELISRAKLVLNLNLYTESRVFEVVRVSYLLSNSKAVVSDLHPDSDIDPDLRDALAFAPPDGIVETCARLIGDDAARHALEHRALETIRRRDIRQILATALKS